jgi:hypothetical protein
MVSSIFHYLFPILLNELGNQASVEPNYDYILASSRFVSGQADFLAMGISLSHYF